MLKLDGLYDLAAVERRVIKHIEKEDEKYEIDFSPSGIELDSFPYNSWRKVSKAVMSGDTGLFNMGEPQGDFELRETISGYLHESRGVNCNPGNIIVGAGDEYLLMLLDQLLTNSHNKVKLCDGESCIPQGIFCLKRNRTGGSSDYARWVWNGLQTA